MTPQAVSVMQRVLPKYVSKNQFVNHVVQTKYRTIYIIEAVLSTREFQKKTKQRFDKVIEAVLNTDWP